MKSNLVLTAALTLNLFSCNLQSNNINLSTQETQTSTALKITKSSINNNRLSEIASTLSKEQTTIFSEDDLHYDYTNLFFQTLYYAETQWTFHAFEFRKPANNKKMCLEQIMNTKFRIKKSKFRGRRDLDLEPADSDTERLNCIDMGTTLPEIALSPLDLMFDKSSFDLTGKTLYHKALVADGCRASFILRKYRGLMDDAAFDISKVFVEDGFVYMELRAQYPICAIEKMYLKSKLNESLAHALKTKGLSRIKKSLGKVVSGAQMVASAFLLPSKIFTAIGRSCGDKIKKSCCN